IFEWRKEGRTNSINISEKDVVRLERAANNAMNSAIVNVAVSRPYTTLRSNGKNHAEIRPRENNDEQKYEKFDFYTHETRKCS
ncbi:hypothetical protein L9F63_025467, partial [Diploptera punctata]